MSSAPKLKTIEIKSFLESLNPAEIIRNAIKSIQASNQAQELYSIKNHSDNILNSTPHTIANSIANAVGTKLTENKQEILLKAIHSAD